MKSRIESSLPSPSIRGCKVQNKLYVGCYRQHQDIHTVEELIHTLCKNQLSPASTKPPTVTLQLQKPAGHFRKSPFLSFSLSFRSSALPPADQLWWIIIQPLHRSQAKFHRIARFSFHACHWVHSVNDNRSTRPLVRPCAPCHGYI